MVGGSTPLTFAASTNIVYKLFILGGAGLIRISLPQEQFELGCIFLLQVDAIRKRFVHGFHQQIQLAYAYCMCGQSALKIFHKFN